MLEEIKKIQNELESNISNLKNMEDLNNLKAYYLGKKGVV